MWSLSRRGKDVEVDEVILALNTFSVKQGGPEKMFNARKRSTIFYSINARCSAVAHPVTIFLYTTKLKFEMLVWPLGVQEIEVELWTLRRGHGITTIAHLF